MKIPFTKYYGLISAIPKEWHNHLKATRGGQILQTEFEKLSNTAARSWYQCILTHILI